MTKNAVTPKIIQTDPQYIQSGFSFTDGRPVPDGILYSEITLQNHPSNIVVFHAANVEEAVQIATHAFRHGKQGAVWLANQPIPFVENNYYARLDRDCKVTDYIQGIQQEFSLLLSKNPLHSTRFDHRREIQSCFDLHADGRLVNMNAGLRAPKVGSFRTLFNIAGMGSILFGRNTIVAAKLLGNTGKFYERLTTDELGPAYVCPAGSVTFFIGGDAGLSNALLHSSPEYYNGEHGSVARELLVVDYFLNHQIRGIHVR